MNRLRRRMGGAVAAVAATTVSLGVLAGCTGASYPGAAAKVGSDQISLSQLDDTVRGLGSFADQYAQQQQQDPTLPSLPTYILQQQIETDLIEQVAAGRGVTATPAAIAKSMPQGVTGSNDAARGFLTDVARSQALVSALTAKKVTQAQLLADLKKIPVTVNPRYGSWDPSKGLTASNGSLSTPALPSSSPAAG